MGFLTHPPGNQLPLKPTEHAYQPLSGGGDRVSLFSVRDLVFYVFKWKWSIFTILLVTMISALVYVFLIRSNQYTVTAEVLVKLGPEGAAPPTMLGNPPQVITYRSQDVVSEANVFQSSDLLREVVRELKMYKSAPEVMPTGFVARMRFYVHRYIKGFRAWENKILIQIGLREHLTPMEKAVHTLQKGLKVTPEKDGNVFVAQLTLPFRKNSSVVMNTLLRDYQNFRLGLFQDNAGVRFFRDKLAQSRTALDEAQESLQQFEQHNEISNFGKQQQLLLNRISQSEQEAHASDLRLQDAQAAVKRFNAVTKQRVPDYAAVGNFPTGTLPTNLIQQIADLRKEIDQLRLTELDSGDRIQNKLRQVKMLGNMLGANLYATLRKRQMDYNLRQQEVQKLQAELNALDTNRVSSVVLKRNEKVKEDDYLFYYKKYQEVATSAAAMEHEHMGSVSIIEHGEDPLMPSGLRKTTLLYLSILISVVLAAAWVAVAEFFDHRIYGSDALHQHLGVPVLGVVPEFRPKGLMSRRHKTKSMRMYDI